MAKVPLSCRPPSQARLWARTILIVEDEPLVALHLHAALREAGAGLIAPLLRTRFLGSSAATTYPLRLLMSVWVAKIATLFARIYPTAGFHSPSIRATPMLRL